MVEDLPPGAVKVRPGARESLSKVDRPPGEILIRKALLDKQIVDIAGAKVVRVNDLQFRQRNGALVLSKVDVGLRGLLRRVGLQRVTVAVLKWLFGYTLANILINWRLVQPVGSSDILRLKFSQSRLANLHPADLADIIEDLDRPERSRLFRALDIDTAADVLEEANPKVQVSLIQNLPADKASDLLEQMSPSKATDLLQELEEPHAQILLKEMEPEVAEDVRCLLTHDEETAGGITTYSLAGAEFGLRLLWYMVPITGFLILIQEMSARMGVVAGKGLAALIRERFGAAVTFYLMIGIVLTNIANTVAEFAGAVAALELFNIPRHFSAPLVALLVWLLVVKGSYRSVEKVFLGACLFYVAYIISGFLAGPDWASVAREVLTPQLDLSPPALIMIVGLVGTTIAPWMQFYLQAAVVDKGLTVRDYRIVRWDVILGSVTVSVVAFFIILVCAVTIHTHGIHIENAKEAALALAPLAGRYAAGLFAFGLLNASLFAASILPLSTAYTVCEAFGWESSVDCKFRRLPSSIPSIRS